MTTAEVASRTGASLRQLQWWDETGLVPVPRIEGRRYYSAVAVARVQAVMVCVNSGVTMRSIRKLAESRPNDFTPWIMANRATIRALLSTRDLFRVESVKHNPPRNVSDYCTRI